MSKHENAVFISYAWGEEREDIVNEIDENLKKRSIKIVRDKRDLQYKGSIKGFMERIGQGDCVIIVISDKYLRSPNCMFELVELAENKDFYERVFPVVLQDADIYDPIKRLKYIKYWEDKEKALDELMKTVNSANLQGLREEIDIYHKIRANIANLTFILKDMNVLTPEMHKNSEFSELYGAILRRVMQEHGGLSKSEKELATRAEAEQGTREKVEVERKAKAARDRIARQKAEERKKASTETTSKINFKPIFTVGGLIIALFALFFIGKLISDNLPISPKPTETSVTATATSETPATPNVAATETSAAELLQTEKYCLACHGGTDLGMTLPSGEKVSLYVSQDQITRSVHRKSGVVCKVCHNDISTYPHPEKFSFHSKRDLSLAFYKTCEDCHLAYYPTVQTGNEHAKAWNTNNLNLDTVICTDCHDYHN